MVRIRGRMYEVWKVWSDESCHVIPTGDDQIHGSAKLGMKTLLCNAWHGVLLTLCTNTWGIMIYIECVSGPLPELQERLLNPSRQIATKKYTNEHYLTLEQCPSLNTSACASQCSPSGTLIKPC